MIHRFPQICGTVCIDWEGSDLKKEFKKEDRFIAINHKSDWDVIRKIDAANGVTYDCK